VALRTAVRADRRQRPITPRPCSSGPDPRRIATEVCKDECGSTLAAICAYAFGSATGPRLRRTRPTSRDPRASFRAAHERRRGLDRDLGDRDLHLLIQDASVNDSKPDAARPSNPRARHGANSSVSGWLCTSETMKQAEAPRACAKTPCAARQTPRRGRPRRTGWRIVLAGLVIRARGRWAPIDRAPYEVVVLPLWRGACRSRQRRRGPRAAAPAETVRVEVRECVSSRRSFAPSVIASVLARVPSRRPSRGRTAGSRTVGPAARAQRQKLRLDPLAASGCRPCRSGGLASASTPERRGAPSCPGCGWSR